MNEAEFRALYDWLRSETPRPATDRRGALRNITPDAVLAATRTVRAGTAVSLAAPVETVTRADNPTPCEHEMLGTVGDDVEDEGLHFATDQLTLHVHGNADTHIDALCHVMYDGRLYNDVPVGAVTSDGAVELSIDVARDGIVGRGVLLDIPRLRGEAWVEPGDVVTYDELVACERAQHMAVGPGDIMLVRLGHRSRRTAVGAWDVASSRAGLDPRALVFAAERKVAALGCDSNSDAAPSVTAAVEFPVHVLAINAMGLQMLDYLQLEALAGSCAERGDWTFLCVIAPLRMPTATGSPVNPIAIL